MIEFLSDWYWEQDEHLRFTVIAGKRMRESRIGSSPVIGKFRWEQERIWDVEDKNWQEHKATLYARKPFKDFIYKITARNGELRYISVSGQPIFDQHGEFKGYRGIGNDVTRQARAELRRTIEHTVTRTLAIASNVAQGAPRIIQVICEALHWSCGAYWECRPDGVPECIGAWGNDTPSAREFIKKRKAGAMVAQFDKCIVLTACDKGESVWISDTTKLDKNAQLAGLGAGSLQSAFALPITIEKKVVSVLEFCSKHIHTPDAETLNCFAVIAKLIAQHTKLIDAHARVRQSEERLRDLIELSSDWIWEQDEHFRFNYLEGNQEVQSNAKFRPTSRLGSRRWDIPALNLTEEDWEKHKEMLNRHETYQDFHIRRATTDEYERWISVSGKPIFDEKGQFKGYRGITKDISERKNNEKRIQYLATHDTLTGLPNRSMLSELISQLIATSARYKRKFAVLFLDLDRFKTINDSLGHDSGDTLLQIASKRLQQCMRASDVVARFGGDEFVVLVQEVEHHNDVEIIARKILTTIANPVTLLGQECRVSGSIGISMYPDHAQDERTLMKNADVAMYQAKESGKNQYAFYLEQTTPSSMARIVLETHLRHAIEHQQLFLQYQPKLDLKNKRVTGVEALLRWQHPEVGVISPAQFIPLAEETGLIVPIGRWVLEMACQQNVSWQRAGLPRFGMAVNLSARQFADEYLIEDVKAALVRTGMAPELLELELTESMVVQKPERARNTLHELKKLGVRIAIDDFGTGYSSFAQLKTLPIDTLKIDRSFICDLPDRQEDRSVTQAIISMGKSMGLTVIAEGVETAEQERFLCDSACDEMQGFYFSEPALPAEIERLIRAGSQH